MKIIVSKKAKKKKKKDSYEENYWKTIYPDDYAEKIVSEEDSKEKNNGYLDNIK